MNPLLIGGIIDTVGKVADSLFTSDEERAKLQIEGLKAETEAYRAESERLGGQLEVNKEEARHASVFVAGWRPGAGWVGVAGFAYAVFLQPLLAWLATVNGWPTPPTIDTDLLWVVLSGMLGIGGLRTYEKAKGVATK